MTPETFLSISSKRVFPDGSVGKKFACNAGDTSLGHYHYLPYSRLTHSSYCILKPNSQAVPQAMSWSLRTTIRRCRFDPWVGKILWRRKWQSTPVFLPGKSHRQRSLAGYDPEGQRVRHDFRNLACMQSDPERSVPSQDLSPICGLLVQCSFCSAMLILDLCTDGHREGS